MKELYIETARRLVIELQPITQSELRFIGRLKGIESSLMLARNNLVARGEIRRARTRVKCGITGRMIHPYVAA